MECILSTQAGDGGGRIAISELRMGAALERGNDAMADEWQNSQAVDRLRLSSIILSKF